MDKNPRLRRLIGACLPIVKDDEVWNKARVEALNAHEDHPTLRVSFVANEDGTISGTGRSIWGCRARVNQNGEGTDQPTYTVSVIVKSDETTFGIATLNLFKNRLGSRRYFRYFPDFQSGQRQPDRFLYLLTDEGVQNLEQVLLDHATGNSAHADLLVEQCIEYIDDAVNDFAREKEPGDYHRMFLQEMHRALTHNVAAANLETNLVPKFETVLERAKFIPTLCHRDLSVRNVMVGYNGRFRLIDPRPRLPREKWDGTGYGSVAVDVATFAVSLMRTEKLRLGQDAEIVHANAFLSNVSDLETKGVYNQYTLDMAMACAYATYASCKCKFCLRPDRLWLFEPMKKQLQIHLSRIA